jgi:hypothetical protein
VIVIRDFDGPGSYGSVIVIDNDTRAYLDALLSNGFGGSGCGMAKPPMNWMLVASEIQWKSNGFRVFTNAAGWWWNSHRIMKSSKTVSFERGSTLGVLIDTGYVIFVWLSCFGLSRRSPTMAKTE